MNNKTGYLSTFTLKLIAIITMTIDHIGVVFGVEGHGGILSYDTYMILRTIGRISFPIFCYLLVEGYYHTKSVKKYALRLFVFAFISQAPYTLTLAGGKISFHKLNIFFTLFLGLFMIWIIDSAISNLKSNKSLHPINAVVVLIAVTGIFYLTHKYIVIDYGKYGLMLILLFYFFKPADSDVEAVYPYYATGVSKNFLFEFISIGAVSMFFSGSLQIYCLFALIPIHMHNHEKGKSIKYLFYVYYPFHLILLYFIKAYLL